MNRSEEAIALLSSKTVYTSDILTHTVPLEDFKQGISLIKNSAETGAMKVAVKPTV